MGFVFDIVIKMLNKKTIPLIIFTLLFLNILTWLAVYNLSQPKFWEVTFFNVGQGDAIFIETPEAHQILIDGGPGSVILEKLGEEMPFWDRSIDLIILSHPEQDHLVGLLEVLKRYQVENILWTGVQRATPEFKEWERLIKEERAEIFIAKVGQQIWAAETVFEILFPFENLEGQEFKNINNTSIILRLIFGDNSFLFTGDAYKSVEREILEKGIDVDSDVLKISHHGSKTSSAQEFIERVSPKIAVISLSENNLYHHPHEATLETLEKYGITVLRTDKEGDIKFFSDGKKINSR